MKRINWRGVLARLPLPMLALAASYGVYSFALLFVPDWVAMIQAAAFELTYVGLAVTQGLDTPQRRRATGISIGAVAASIIYNTLAGWFHAQPQLLAGAGPIAWLCLAVMHGAPLAWVAYLVADLLLHSQNDARAVERAAALETEVAQLRADLEIARATEGIDPRKLAQQLALSGVATRTIARMVERPESTIRGWLAAAMNGHAIEVE